jgi:ribosomal protein S18 acetylase RimI-like enzyme
MQNSDRHVATVFVAVARASATLHGFYSLSMAGVAVDFLPDVIRRKMPRYPSVPAVRLGRLAIHVDARGRGLGTHLLMDAMARSLESEIAWFAFLVDAKDDQARSFYSRFGFQSFQDDPDSLFLTRKTIEPLFD